MEESSSKRGNDEDDHHHMATQPVTHKDPLVVTQVFETNKIKNFLYKQEPNTPRLTQASLDLVSTTAALFLKSLVEKAAAAQEENNGPHLWVTAGSLKRVVLEGNSDDDDDSMEFLKETYEGFRDRDSSSRWQEYAPRKKSKRSNAPSPSNNNNQQPSYSQQLPESLSATTDAAPLEKVIRDAAATTNTANSVLEDIVEDDSDYD